MRFFKEELKRIRTSRLAKDTGWMMLGQVASYAAQAAYFVVVSRLLGVAQFGVLAGAVAFVNIVAPYGSMGSGIVFMNHVSEDRDNCRMYMGHVFLSSMTISGLLILAVLIAAPHFLSVQSAAITWMVAVSTCFSAPLTLSLSQIFQTFKMPRAMTAFNVLNSTALLIAAVALKLSLRHAHAWQWALTDMCVSLFVAAIAIPVIIKRFGAPRFSIRLLVKHVPEGFGYSSSLSAGAIYNNFDKALLSHYGMTVADGFYTLAYRVTTLATMPSYAIEMAAIPRMFEKAHNKASELRAFGHGLVKRSALIGALVSVLLFLAAPLIPYIVGSGFRPSVLVLRWLCLLPLFRSIHVITGSMLTASGHQKYRVIAQFLVAGVALALDLWLIPRYGWIGAAWASLVADAALAIACYALVQIVLSAEEYRERKPA